MKQNKTQLSFKLAGIGMTTLIAIGLYANVAYKDKEIKTFNLYNDKPVVLTSVKSQGSVIDLLQGINTANTIFEDNYYPFREMQVEERKIYLKNIKAQQIKERQEKIRIEKEKKEKEQKEKECQKKLQEEQLKAQKIKTAQRNLSRGTTNNTYRGFNSNNLLMPSNVSRSQLSKVLSKYDKGKYIDAYIDAEHQYGVNALLLVAISITESGWNNSPLARASNNLTSICGGSKHYASGYDCIMHTAKLLKQNYLVKSGKYYHGNSVRGVNFFYCVKEDGHTPNYNWTDSVITIANKISNKL